MKKLFSGLLILLLGGCAGLPTAVDIKAGPELVAPAAQELSFYTPSGPAVDASAQEIISGFLGAGTGPQNDYAVARQYLTTDFAQRWNPEGAVLIRTGTPVFQAAGDTLQVVEVKVSAKLDEQGRYEDYENAKSSALRFQLLQQDGQWRISSAPNLTVVTPPVFAVVFKAYPIYFLDSRRNHLMPDLRWFATKASTGTKLVNAMLDGPSPWLAAGVQSAIPDNTRLTIDAVRVVDGVAQVDLDGNALQADALDRRLMLSQLRATLLQLSGVFDVELSINNSPQDIIPAPIVTSQTGGSAFVLSDGGVSRIASGESGLIPGSPAFVKSREPKLFAITSGGNKVVFSTEQGVFLSEVSGLTSRVQKISDTTNLAAISFDDVGLIWLFPTDAALPIEIQDSNGSVSQVSEGLIGTRTSVAIGPEGSRLAVAVSNQGKSRIHIMTVNRDSGSYPKSLNAGLDLLPVLGIAISLCWQEAAVLRVLEQTASNMTALSDYPLTGPRFALTMPPVVGTSITAGPASLSTYMISQNDEVWVLTGTTWRRSLVKGFDLATLR